MLKTHYKSAIFISTILLGSVLGLSYNIAHAEDLISKTSDNKERVIITYKNNTSEAKKKEIEKEGDITQEFENLNSVSLEVDEELVEKLENDPSIHTVEEDHFVSIQSTKNLQPVNYAISNLNGNKAWEGGLSGFGVKIGVIDSGIARHSDLIIAGGKSFVDYTTSYYDDNGHGTHVAGIISAENNSIGVVGIAPDSRVYALKAMDSKGEGYLSDIIAAIDWSIENKMDIINLSLVSSEASTAFKAALDKAYSNNILIVAAAGNDGKNQVYYPAKYSSVVGVSALDQDNKIAAYSNRGNEIELSAPGSYIESLFIGNTYQYMSGTSMAAPYVTGIAALIKQEHPEYSAVQLRTSLRNHTIDLGTKGIDPYYGYGLIQSPGTLSVLNAPSTLNAKSTTNSVTLDWASIPNTSKYQLYRDGVLIYQGINTSFIDTKLKTNTSINYSLYVNKGNYRSYIPTTLSTKTLGTAKKQLTSYVTPSKSTFTKGSRTHIGVYSRHSGNQTVPNAKIVISIKGPGGNFYSATKYTDSKGSYMISLPSTNKTKSGKYTVTVTTSKSDMLSVIKSNTFSIK